jgi:MoaA/NifB/PqqE/SkfB family radical SAM enzyme
MASRPVMQTVRQPTISYDGVEIPDFGDRRFSYGIIEVTKHCNLRCTTCFFFQAFQHAEKNLPEQEMIAKLRALQKRHRIKFMSWVGGEPLLRRRIVEQAPLIFESNIVFTNGTLPIPDLPVAIAVSLDGPPEINDAIRGKGGHERVVRTLRTAPRPVLIQSVITTRNASVIEQFTAELTALPNVMGVIYSIYVPQKGDASGLGFRLPERDAVVERLLRLKEKHGTFLMNGFRAMELMLSSTCKQVTDRCDMRESSLALDYQLQRRRPCCYGENVDCELCAALTPFAIAARAEQGAAASAVSGFVPVARRRS